MDIARRLDSSRRFVFVKRRLSPDVAEAVHALKEPALGFVEESMRLYPNRELAAHVVGFEGVDGRGLGGVEQSWDPQLAGVEVVAQARPTGAAHLLDQGHLRAPR